MTDITNILEQRGVNYGTFSNQANLSQALKNTIMQHYYATHGNEKATPLPGFMAESISMICHKLARIANGNPYYEDSWKDISGYAELTVQALEQLAKIQAEQAKKQNQEVKFEGDLQ